MIGSLCTSTRRRGLAHRFAALASAGRSLPNPTPLWSPAPSESKELNFLLVPFLSHKMPEKMKVNAAVLMRQLLSRSAETTGYALSLSSLKLRSLLVEGESLVMDVDANLKVD